MTTTNKLTADTITDEQIETLRTEALAAGDGVQVDLCDEATGSLTARHRPGRRASARQTCADVINNARAQDDAS